MRRRTLILIGTLMIVLLLVMAHMLNLASVLGALNPHALR